MATDLQPPPPSHKAQLPCGRVSTQAWLSPSSDRTRASVSIMANPQGMHPATTRPPLSASAARTSRKARRILLRPGTGWCEPLAQGLTDDLPCVPRPGQPGQVTIETTEPAGLVHRQLLVHPCRQPHGILAFRCYHRLFSGVSSKGRNSAAMASRARNIRERTVPIGQFMRRAISSYDRPSSSRSAIAWRRSS